MAQPALARPKINTEVTQLTPGGASRRLAGRGKDRPPGEGNGPRERGDSSVGPALRPVVG